MSSTRSPGRGAAASKSNASISALRASCTACRPTQRGPATSFQYRPISALPVAFAAPCAAELRSLMASDDAFLLEGGDLRSAHAEPGAEHVGAVLAEGRRRLDPGRRPVEAHRP